MRVLRTATAVLAGGGLALAVSAPALADNPVLRDTVHITGNVDSGHHGYWARLDYDRTVRIAPHGEGQWTVLLIDRGTFTTITGSDNSPRRGRAVADANGSINGRFQFQVTSDTKPSADQVDDTYDYDCTVPGTGNRNADCPGMPAGTSMWPQLYFGDQATITPGDYRWVYRTMCKDKLRERWVDASTNDDGMSPHAGDITGKACPCPTPSDSPTGEPSESPTGEPSTSPSVSTSPSGQPSKSTMPSLSPTAMNGGGGGSSGGGLPVTGTPVALFGGLGALILAAGGVLLFLARRRRQVS